MAKVKPLTKKTMRLNELQLRTLDVLRKVKFQFQRRAHEDGMSDSEFVDQVIDTLATDIYQDRQVLKQAKAEKKKARKG